MVKECQLIWPLLHFTRVGDTLPYGNFEMIFGKRLWKGKPEIRHVISVFQTGF